MRSSEPPVSPDIVYTADPTVDPAVNAERVQRWQITRDARALWPALESARLQPAADAVGKAVASCLRGDKATLGASDGCDAYAIGIAALLSGTGPLLGGWVEQGALDVHDALARILARHVAHNRA